MCPNPKCVVCRLDLTDGLHLHTGYGIDQPLARHPIRYQTDYANLICDLKKSVTLNFEVMYRKTDFVIAPAADEVIILTRLFVRL